MTSQDPDLRAALPPAARLWVGTYAGGGGEGVYPLHRDDEGAEWATHAADGVAQNCSFGVHAVRTGLHYLVDEHDGSVGVFRNDDDASRAWECLARIPAGGAAPCHIALDRSESWFAVANYVGGSIMLQRLDPETGLPLGGPLLRANAGSGPNPDRQEAPHAHWVGFSADNRWLYATDLGTDEVLAFAFDAGDGTFGPPVVAFDAPAGSGPRHLLLHPNRPGLAYLACELTSELMLLDVSGSAFVPRMRLSTLPADAAAESIVAHIAANAAGYRLYVSNRGDDSIAVFALDDRGEPGLLQHIASGGASPRFFLLLEDEARMVVVHERDHRITMLDILPDGTLATSDSVVTVPGAAFAFVAPPTGLR